MKTKILALATLAVVSISSAHAKVIPPPIAPATPKIVDLGPQTPKTDQTLSFVSTAYSDYSETYTFTTAKDYNLKTTTVENGSNATSLIGNNITLYKLTGGTYTAVPTDSYDFNIKAINGYFSNLAAGSYELVLIGRNTTKYDTTVDLNTKLSKIKNDTITAVPEPETYAMLLAGLGLMGFMSRRRKSS